MDKNEALDALDAANNTQMLAEVARDMAVYAARDAGASWTDVGLKIGMTKQAAHERYAPPQTRGNIERRGAAVDEGRREAEQILDEIRKRNWGAEPQG